MPKLLLVRHGQTQGNSAQRFWGRTDTPLSDTGRAQAACLRERLRDTRIDAVYASSLSRAQETAAIITDDRKQNITACSELIEMDFGDLEGLTFAEIAVKYPELAADLAKWTIRPRFPGGESMEEFAARVSGFVPRLKNHGQEETILVVAHSGSLRQLICRLLELDIEYSRRFRLELASLSVLDTYPATGNVILSLLNSTSHLKGIKETD